MDDIKIRMLQNVRPDFPLGIIGLLGEKPGTILRASMEYQAMSNKNGAISGLCENGEYLGVKPGEFEFIVAPEWVLDIWKGRKECRLLEQKPACIGLSACGGSCESCPAN